MRRACVGCGAIQPYSKLRKVMEFLGVWFLFFLATSWLLAPAALLLLWLYGGVLDSKSLEPIYQIALCSLALSGILAYSKKSMDPRWKS